MNPTWDAIMESRTCLVQALDQNSHIRDELHLMLDALQTNHRRMETALTRLDTLVGAPSHTCASGQNSTRAQQNGHDKPPPVASS